MNIFTLFGQIAINNQGALKAISDTSKQAKKMNDQMQQSFEKIGSFAVKCGKVIASGLAVGTAAIGSLAKASIGSYADYEQLIGGIETLFKESQNKVMEYANNAYKTAGLSANEYMETATSFSASLLQGLGGDTEKAAEYANKAITDMSDNANKMGTDMGLIQNAYQGFAKQNYTMLDNLKLGYGGTQEEMARLVNESGVLGAAIKVDAKTINDVSFDKIIQAIHIVQERMGIAGTTAKEASETISGSVASFKATWKNLLVGLADDDQNLNTLWENFIGSGETVIRNVGRVLPNLHRNIGTVVERVTQYAGLKIKTGWNETIWPFVQEQMKIHFGVELPDWQTVKTNLQAGWDANVQPLIEGFKTSIGQVFDWFTQNGESVMAVIEAIAFVFAGTWLAAHPLKAALGLLAGAFVVLNTDTTEASEPIKNIKSFLEDIKAWIDENKTVVTAFFGSLAFALLALNWPLGLLIAAVAFVILNWEGLKTVIGLVVEKINEAVETIKLKWEELKKALTPIDTSVSVHYSESGVQHGGGAGKSFGSPDGVGASGISRIPFDGFRAILHKDETVLNRHEADIWRSGGMRADTGRLEALMGNMIALMQQMVNNTAAGQNIVLDSGVLVGQLAPSMNAQLGVIGARNRRGNS